MPRSENWPFKRVMVDHLFHGTTSIWWQLEESFTDPQRHQFQLQAGYTGNNNALDWVDIGAPACNTYFLQDDTARERHGKLNLTHYRVILTTPNGKYVSNPQGIFTVLDNKDWITAREIIRKENLRQDKVSPAGYLIKRMYYGVRNTENTDFLTNEVIDSRELSSWGTAFKVGYHPPIDLQMDFAPETITLLRGGDNVAKHNAQPDEVTARVTAIPQLSKEDVWVDASTDERFAIHEIKIDAALRRYPLVYSVRLRKLPQDNVVYQIPVTAQSYPPIDEDFEPTTGSGCVRVDQNYGEDDRFTYQTADCCGIEGASILIFTKTDYDGGARTISNAAAVSVTTSEGKWAYSVMLDPGEYVVVFEKYGEYGPDAVCFTVDPPETSSPPPYCPPDSSSDSSFSSSFGSV